MSFARFCAICAKPYYAKRNFLRKLWKINILSKEITTEDLFNYYIQKLLTYEYDFTTLNWLLSVTKVKRPKLIKQKLENEKLGNI